MTAIPSVPRTDAMTRPPRSRYRRTLYVAVGLLLCLAVGWLVVRHYLASQRLAALVAGKIQSAYGVPVEVAGAALGWHESRLVGLQLSEPEGSSPRPWLRVGELATDLTVWDLLHGVTMPRRLTLQDAEVYLRFDRDGHLLTQLPKSENASGAWPDLQLRQGCLTIQQTGRPEFRLEGIDGSLHVEGNQLTLTGSAHDSSWGDWTLEGRLDRDTNTGALQAKAPRLHVTQAMLNSLPLVPEETWKQVQAKGDTSADIDLHLERNAPRLHYHIALAPDRVQVEIPSIGLHATETSGSVDIRDEIVRLQGIHGQTANGTLQLNSTLDFHREQALLTFAIQADRLDLQQLPSEWGLPKQLTGRLSGQAQLQLEIRNGRLEPRGQGQGEITDARLGGAPVAKPIRIRLQAAGAGYRFQSEEPGAATSSQSLKPVTPWLLVALRVPDTPPADQESLLHPGPLANALGSALLHGIQSLTRSSARWIDRLSHYVQAPPPANPTSNMLDVSLSLEEVELDPLLRGLGAPAPFPVAGRVNLQVRVAVPLSTSSDLKAYRLTGTATSRHLNLAGIAFDAVRARVHYDQGSLQLQELQAHVPSPAAPGVVTGTARMQVVPMDDLKAQLQLQNISLAQVLAMAPTLARTAAGRFSSTLDLQVPAAELAKPDRWQVRGSMDGQALQIVGLKIDNLHSPIALQRGLLTLAGIRGRVEGTPVEGSAELRLAAPYRFRAGLGLRDLDLAFLQRLAPDFRPPVAIDGKFTATADLKGALQPLQLESSGTSTARDLRVARIPLGTLSWQWTSDAATLHVTKLSGDMADGKVTGSADLPLRATVPGRIDVQFQDVNFASLTRALPSMPLRLEGQASGSIVGRLTAAAPGRPRSFTSKIDLQAPHLRVQNIPTQKLHGTVEANAQRATYQVEGETLGGRFQLQGEVPLTESKPPTPGATGRFKLEGARLGQLGRALAGNQAIPALRGIINAELDFRSAHATDFPEGRGRWSATRLAWKDTVLADSVGGDLVLANGELRFRDLTGFLSQGILRGQVALNLRQPARSWFSLALDGAEAASLLAPWPSLARTIEGPIQGRLRGTLGREWNGSGEFNLVRGKVAGLEVSNWRLPFDWAFAPAMSRGQIQVQESTAQLAGGRVLGQVTVGWADRARVEGRIRFFDLELRSLLRQAGDFSQIGQGTATGRIELAAADVETINDLAGTVDATFAQTQALQLPILQQAAPFLIPGQGSTAFFQRGDFKARFAGGTLRIEKLSFVGSLLQLLVEGTVTFQGRLGLDITANSGRIGPSPALLRLLGVSIPAAGPIPIGLLTQATNYLSNRLIHLRVTGTIRNPVITVEPLSLLTQEAFLFFVNRANLPLP